MHRQSHKATRKASIGATRRLGRPTRAFALNATPSLLPNHLMAFWAAILFWAVFWAAIVFWAVFGALHSLLIVPCV
jgi:hypothetical protein